METTIIRIQASHLTLYKHSLGMCKSNTDLQFPMKSDHDGSQ